MTKKQIKAKLARLRTSWNLALQQGNRIKAQAIESQMRNLMTDLRSFEAKELKVQFPVEVRAEIHIEHKTEDGRAYTFYSTYLYNVGQSTWSLQRGGYNLGDSIFYALMHDVEAIEIYE